MEIIKIDQLLDEAADLKVSFGNDDFFKCIKIQCALKYEMESHDKSIDMPREGDYQPLENAFSTLFCRSIEQGKLLLFKPLFRSLCGNRPMGGLNGRILLNAHNSENNGGLDFKSMMNFLRNLKNKEKNALLRASENLETATIQELRATTRALIQLTIDVEDTGAFVPLFWILCGTREQGEPNAYYTRAMGRDSRNGLHEF